ncbi:MAG: LysR family transcriptional regulator [Rhodospirillales bacterium]|nr:LysR family transcriptional regulator [Rhodospirillales bacterium]
MRLVRSFLAVAAERSFSVAAELQGCSQGTMSLRIRTLEDQLGIRLFDRKHSKIRLITAGQDLLPSAQDLVSTHDLIAGRARTIQHTGTVRIGVAEGNGIPLLTELLASVREHSTTIEISIVCQLSRHLLQEIQTGTLDLAVVTTLEEIPSAILLDRPRSFCVAAPEFAADGGAPPPVALSPDGCQLRTAALEALQRQGISYREMLATPSGALIESTVSAGLAVTIMAEGAVLTNLRVVRQPALLPPLGTVCVHLVQSAAPQSEAVRAMKQAIAGTYRVSWPGRGDPGT